MALPVNIDDLINHRKVESARIEYKKGWNPEKVLHTLCAFANDIDNWGGGYVILGIEEQAGRPKRPLMGLPVNKIDRIQRELLEVCHLISPVYIPVVEPVEYEGANLLIVWAPGGCERPYKCPIVIDGRAHSERVHFIRKLASTVRASQSDEKRLYEMSGNVPFDDRANMHAEVADLKVNLMADYLREIGSALYAGAENMSPSALARDLRISEGASECVKPKNVGLMFFNPHPDEFFRCAQIEVVYKPVPTGDGMVEKKFVGPLHIQLQEALAHIRNSYLQEKIFKFDDRAKADRIWNYPYRAVEEALSNAVYHKSYERAEPITVVITPESMTITSVPGPDMSISDEDLRKCHLVGMTYRNRRIGDFLKELHMVEGRNTGVPQIVGAMRDNRSPSPIFSTPSTRAWFSVVLPVNKVFAEKSSVKSSRISSAKPSYGGGNMEVNSVAESLRKLLLKRNLRRSQVVVLRMAKIVVAMKRNGFVSIEDLAQEFKLTRRTIDADVASLKELKAIKRVGATRNSQWRIVIC